MKRALNKIAELPDIRAVHKARLRVEAGRDVAVHGVEFQVARTALREHLVGRPGEARAVRELGFAGDRLRLHLPVLPKAELRVEPANAVESNRASRRGAEAVGRGVQLAVGIDQADAV